MAKVTRKPTGVRRSAAVRNRSQKARAARSHTSGLFWRDGKRRGDSESLLVTITAAARVTQTQPPRRENAPRTGA